MICIRIILDEEVIIECFYLLIYIARCGEGSIRNFRFIAAITRCCYIGDRSLTYNKAIDELGDRLEYRLAHNFDFRERFQRFNLVCYGIVIKHRLPLARRFLHTLLVGIEGAGIESVNPCAFNGGIIIVYRCGNGAEIDEE